MLKCPCFVQNVHSVILLLLLFCSDFKLFKEWLITKQQSHTSCISEGITSVLSSPDATAGTGSDEAERC